MVLGPEVSQEDVIRAARELHEVTGGPVPKAKAKGKARINKPIPCNVSETSPCPAAESSTGKAYYAFTPRCGLEDSRFGVACGQAVALSRLPAYPDGTRSWIARPGGPARGINPAGFSLLEEAINHVAEAQRVAHGAAGVHAVGGEIVVWYHLGDVGGASEGSAPRSSTAGSSTGGRVPRVVPDPRFPYQRGA